MRTARKCGAIAPFSAGGNVAVLGVIAGAGNSLSVLRSVGPGWHPALPCLGNLTRRCLAVKQDDEDGRRPLLPLAAFEADRLIACWKRIFGRSRDGEPTIAPDRGWIVWVRAYGRSLPENGGKFYQNNWEGMGGGRALGGERRLGAHLTAASSAPTAA